MKNKLGANFLENIDYKKAILSRKNNFNETPAGRNTFFFFYFLLIIFFLALFSRLFRLQIIEGKYFKQKTENNRIWEKNLPAFRGIIKDRNGEILVQNFPIFKKQREGNLIQEYLTKEEVLKEEFIGKNKSKILTLSGRRYLYPEEFAHILGYLGEIDSQKYKENQKKCSFQKNDSNCQIYLFGDLLGKVGLEEKYEALLRGRNGRELIELDANGKIIKTLVKINPRNGHDLLTTLDLGLQLTAYKSLAKAIENTRSEIGEKLRGAVITANPLTGEILALVSFPSFDPNIFQNIPSSKDNLEYINQVLSSTEKPLLNRAISGMYPPGSTYKIVTAVAALQSRKIRKETVFEDIGVLKIGKYEFPNWAFLKSGVKDGFINIVTALKRSNDIYFYKAGEEIGIDTLAYWSKKFYLGKISGIDLSGEAEGLIPGDSWKRDTLGEKWFLGDTYHLAIGQGYLLVTPLQVNNWTNVIANQGYFCKPHLYYKSAQAEQDFRNEGKLQETKIVKTDKDCLNLGLEEGTIKIVSEGMKLACMEGGTGWPLFNFKVGDPRGKDPKIINVSCKTGTAEYGEKDADGKSKTHAWFTAYASSQKPEISVTVLVEEGGEGSDVAAPIAKEIFEEWFKR